MAKKTNKKPAFKLEGDAQFALTGRGTTAWFNLVEPDDEYSKYGGKFFPDDVAKMQDIIDDVLAETKAELDEADIEATAINPQKTDDNGNVFYNVSRASTKANGDDAIIKLRNKRGKMDEDVLDDVELGNGSVVNMKVMYRGYYMPGQETAGVTIPARYGVSMMPLEVQVIDHKVYENEGGFDDETGDDDDNEFDDTTSPVTTDSKSDDY
jgi:hypothetical protein